MRPAFFFALVLPLAGCAIDPVSGWFGSGMTSEQERRLGAEAAARVAQQMGLVQAPPLAEYVDTVGQRLAEQSPRRDVEYRFHVVDVPDLNAFALPGGWIYVTRGLLAVTNSEDELANVTGHEIGHVAARHQVEGQVHQVPFLPARFAGALAGMLTGVVSPGPVRVEEGGPEPPGALVLAAYSGEEESQADRLGQQLAAAAGWDPLGMASMMETFALEEKRAGGDPSHIGWLADHPSSPDRVREAAERAPELERGPTPPIADGRNAYLRHLDGILVGESAAKGRFVKTQFFYPALDFAIRFPEGWTTLRSDAAVAAHSPDEKAVSLLQLVPGAKDPLEAAKRFQSERHARFEGDPQAVRIRGLPAARAVASRGILFSRVKMYVAWIGYRGHVFQVIGATTPGEFVARRKTLASVPASFRPLTEADRTRLPELRLRMVEAREGETLEQILERAPSGWTPEETAIANGLELQMPLEAGTLVKIAHEEPYSLPAERP